MSEQCPVCQATVEAGSEQCSRCGFKLLGATQRFDPLEMEGRDGAKNASLAQAYALRVVRGPQTGISYALTEDELTVGRSPRCSVFLNDMTVSRMHATLTRCQNSYVIADQNSFNGVWINNKNVEQKVLVAGDFIQIGTFCLVYEENPV